MAKLLEKIKNLFKKENKQEEKRGHEIHLKCIDCGKTIVLTEGEQAFYKEKGFLYPKRCKECREKRKNWRKAKSKHKIDNKNK